MVIVRIKVTIVATAAINVINGNMKDLKLSKSEGDGVASVLGAVRMQLVFFLISMYICVSVFHTFTSLEALKVS